MSRFRFHPPIEFKDPNAFRFRIADDGEREFHGAKVRTLRHRIVIHLQENDALQGQRDYSFVFDYPLKRMEEYKVTLFAEDDHYCHTADITTYFNTSAVAPTSLATVIPPWPSLSSSSESASDVLIPPRLNHSLVGKFAPYEDTRAPEK